MRVELAMVDSQLQLFVLIDPVAQKFSDKEPGKSQNVCGTFEQVLLKFRLKDCHISPTTHEHVYSCCRE